MEHILRLSTVEISRKCRRSRLLELAPMQQGVLKKIRWSVVQSLILCHKYNGLYFHLMYFNNIFLTVSFDELAYYSSWFPWKLYRRCNCPSVLSCNGQAGVSALCSLHCLDRLVLCGRCRYGHQPAVGPDEGSSRDSSTDPKMRNLCRGRFIEKNDLLLNQKAKLKYIYIY